MPVLITPAATIAREGEGVYEASGAAAGSAQLGGLLGLTVDELWGQRLDELDDRDLSDSLVDLQAGMDQLEVLRGRLIMAVRERRAAARAASGRPAISERSQDREMREQLEERLGMSGPEAARVHRQSKALADLPEPIAMALRAGLIRPEQAQLIADAARQLKDHPGCAPLLAELLEAAQTEDAVELGRRARRRIAELDPQEPDKQAERNRETRRASFRQDPDGSVRFSGQVWGIEAERLLTGIRAFTRPDAPDNPRNSGQRTADALDDLVAAALERGTAPSEHGIRPQLLIVIPWQTLVDREGLAEGVHTGPLPFSEVSHLLDDAVLARCVLGTDGTPIEMSEVTRTVGASLWRALVVRDGGCRWPTCDAPPGFCEVAHGPVPFRAGGRLTPANSLLLCRPHHRDFDQSDMTVRIEGDRVDFFLPDGTRFGATDTGSTRRSRGRGQAGRPDRPVPGGGSGSSGSSGASDVSDSSGGAPGGPDPPSDRS